MRFPELHSWHLLKNERGTALFAATMAMLLMSITLASFMALGRDEVLIAQNDVDAVRARFAAEGGANHGRWMLAQRVRNDLPFSVAGVGKPAMVASLNGTYNSAAGAAQFIVDMARGAVGPNFVICPAGACPEPTFVAEIPDSQQAVLTLTSGNPAHTTRVIVSAVGPPVLGGGGNTALFIYSWRVEGTGTSNQTTEPVIHDSVSAGNPVGQFTIQLQANFVQYAHFINNMGTAADPWISFRHAYTGPVHTNQRFNILGNAPTALQLGPIFQGAATQTFPDTRFNNGGTATTIASDSTASDQSVLGQFPGTPCQVVDCTGFTRQFDFDPTTTGACNPAANPPGPGCDIVPVPTGAGAADRTTMIFGGGGNAGAVGPLVLPANPVMNCIRVPPCAVPVFVANEIDPATGNPGYWISSPGPIPTATLNGGIFVQGNVVDLQLGAYTGQTIQNGLPVTAIPANGQVIIIQTLATRRTVIAENRLAVPISTTVVRQCLGPAATGVGCGGAANNWNTDTTLLPPIQNRQVLNGVLSPNNSIDFGVIFVTGNIGANAANQGLRRVPGGAIAAAIDQNTRLTIGAGSGTPAANQAPIPVALGGGTIGGGTRGDIYIAGNVNYQIDPRGAEVPLPVFGVPPGTGDDQIAVQNVLGVVSWDGGIYLSPNGLPAVGDVILHAMFMAPNLTGGAGTGEGQFIFGSAAGNACSTAFRGRALLLGGVVQMSMGCLGTPGSPGLGYSRNWMYDERFRVQALTPPVFPGFPNFTTNVSVGIDSYGWRAGRFTP